METTYTRIRDELLQIDEETLPLFATARGMTGAEDDTFRSWEEQCRDIRRQLSEDLLRVAVVGPIKSGKSTFVNSLFAGDYLKRGAGVVTAIVTRIRRGDRLRATLFFKSWDEVNADMEQAMVLFPSLEWRSETERFDIRRDRDRTELLAAFENLNPAEAGLIVSDARNTDSVLLDAYLKGYDRVKDILSDEPVTLEYSGEQFETHKDFSGDDTLAVYLHDIALEIDTGDMETNIEIADCQGSDSPNPLHLAMIQDYLLRTHLIVYVISSRTGLRQADIKFLSAIRKMGIIGTALFLVNFDFGEHEDVDDLNRLVGKVREELALITPSPAVYSVSALYNLFAAREEKLSTREKLRFAQWKAEKDFCRFSDKETGRFNGDMHRKLTRERYGLLLKNHLERLDVIRAGMARWAGVNRDMLMRDTIDVNDVLEGMKQHRKKTDRLRGLVRSTLDGAVREIEQTLRSDTNRFFDNHSGVLGDTLRFLHSYAVPFAEYEQSVEASGFSNSLYLVFQEMKRALDTHLAETVHPEVVRFVREEEGKIRDHFAAVAGPYDTMVRDALTDYNETMKTLGIPPVRDDLPPLTLPDLASVRESDNIQLPPASASMYYSATIRTEAVMRRGAYQMVRFLKKLFRRPVEEKQKGDIRALKAGTVRLKRETEKSLLFHFKDYRENIKFQYLIRLARTLADRLHDRLMDRFETYAADLTRLAERVTDQRVDKTTALETLEAMETECRHLEKRIHHLRTEIERLGNTPAKESRTL